jgi:pyruvate carboxylase
MTAYESMVHWLNGILGDPANEFPANMETVIDAEAPTNLQEVQNADLPSSSNDTHEQLLGGQARHTVFKILHIKRPFSEFPDKLENELFLEKIKKAIYYKNLCGIVPDDGREWRFIGYSGGAYPSQMEENSEYAIYQISLKLVYEE